MAKLLLMEGASGLRDEELLSSALALAQNQYGYEKTDFYQLAAGDRNAEQLAQWLKQHS